ncbi:hypothetical protein [Dickeya phage Sucellus]|nr:hypothetical protein [Dickeya phage Sucellus]
MMSGFQIEKTYSLYYVYQVYRLRKGGGPRVKVIKITSTGSKPAIQEALNIDGSIRLLINNNSVNMFYYATKLMGESSPELYGNDAQIIDDRDITPAQAKWFEQHRVIK